MNVDELTCKLECQDLIIRYFYLLDTGPRSEMKDLFTDDARMARPGDPDGADPATLFAGIPANFFPVHLTSNVVVRPTGPDTAEGEAYIVAYNMFGNADDKLPRPMQDTPNRIGKSSYEFRKTEKGWKIERTKGVHTFIDDGRT